MRSRNLVQFSIYCDMWMSINTCTCFNWYFSSLATVLDTVALCLFHRHSLPMWEYCPSVSVLTAQFSRVFMAGTLVSVLRTVKCENCLILAFYSSFEIQCCSHLLKFKHKLVADELLLVMQVTPVWFKSAPFW